VTTISYDSFAALRHAMGQTREQIIISGCPFFIDMLFQFIDVSRITLLNSALQIIPQILYWVEVRRVRREVNALDSVRE
jgi:hypothetical protein